ncbi:uncharacterized protein ColSpa_06353 [Colletotrichum spaethianum]|uniref:Uncharacterized protein n=1 Tax=Colletotrichum spaethianum TaxID=700344 RepID=A0AA37LCV8_9PEZI|nr:uncharacterized protein ColSpa_06353 [Colletotrichum spaethianum]GKT46172.1 hypothetical protein ColSpa_06353 [Colletotrichum spaethianum]
MVRVAFVSICLAAIPGAIGATLIASHYSGQLYTLNLSSTNQLTIAKSVSSGNRMPAWLDLDSTSKTVYIPDEIQWGQPLLKSFLVAADGSLTPKGQVQTAGGELHSTLYGGSDGKGFVALAQ